MLNLGTHADHGLVTAYFAGELHFCRIALKHLGVLMCFIATRGSNLLTNN